jgi:hypothetical protein
MNMRSLYLRILPALMGALLPLSALCQGSLGDGTFQNLDFSGADVVFVGNSAIQIETGPALPGWTASIGGNPQAAILFNNITLSGSAIALLGPATPAAGANYGVDLLGAGTGPSGTSSIQQTGIVPVGANSIQFNSSSYPFYPATDISFGLTMNGHQVNLLPLTMANNIWTYGGNISQYGGTSVTMSFYSVVGNLIFDDITFSSQSIPEPGALALFSLGSMILVCKIRCLTKLNGNAA